MSFGVIIPAAGEGKRMKSVINKQYLNLLEQPILAHSITSFLEHPAIEQLIVVVKEDELDYCRKDIVEKYFFKKKGVIKLVAGGETRRQSVFYGLKAFSPAINSVIIHDGARPLVTQDIINKVINSLAKYQAVAVGIGLKDTVKKINDDKVVIETPNRNRLVSIQTPQAFSYDLIYKAHQKVPQTVQVTDDASLVEALGYPVKVIEGSEENIKITTKLDLIIARLIMENRGK